MVQPRKSKSKRKNKTRRKSRRMRGGSLEWIGMEAVAPKVLLGLDGTPENIAQAKFWNEDVPRLLGVGNAEGVYNIAFADNRDPTGPVMGEQGTLLNRVPTVGVKYLGTVSSLNWLIQKISRMGDDLNNLQLLVEIHTIVKQQRTSRESAPWAIEEGHRGYIEALQNLEDALKAIVDDLESRKQTAGAESNALVAAENKTGSAYTSLFPALGSAPGPAPGPAPSMTLGSSPWGTTTTVPAPGSGGSGGGGGGGGGGKSDGDSNIPNSFWDETGYGMKHNHNNKQQPPEYQGGKRKTRRRKHKKKRTIKKRHKKRKHTKRRRKH